MHSGNALFSSTSPVRRCNNGANHDGNEPQHHTHKGFKNLNMGPKKQERADERLEDAVFSVG